MGVNEVDVNEEMLTLLKDINNVLANKYLIVICETKIILVPDNTKVVNNNTIKNKIVTDTISRSVTMD